MPTLALRSTSEHTMDTDKQTTARGLIDIEAYLYREAHLSAARRRLADFTARATDFSPGQKRDLERWYLDEQQYVARMVTDHIADSIGAVEKAHRIRFGRWLRGTLLAMTLISVVLFVCAALVIGMAA
ncbi:hypothetical protein [Streptomyces sp. NPDC052127]|uniref:hypothetical protein n=1 Tax=Streptomyces sp. NPDC052127 TaxID=3155679 RepID=UPI0034394606